MGDLDRDQARRPGVALDGDQSGVGQAADDGLDVRWVGAGRDELTEGGPTSGVLASLAGPGQPEEDPAADLAPGLVELADDLVGAVPERPWSSPSSL